VPTDTSTTGHRPPRVTLAPEAAPAWLAEAIVAGGGQLVTPPDAEAVVWFDAHRPTDLVPVLEQAPDARWVHLPWAGVEPYADIMSPDRLWTCGKGVYAEPVAEHAVALALAGLRGLPDRVRARSWGRQGGASLYDRPVTVLGGGGITEVLLGHLAPMRCEVTVVRRTVRPLPGAARVLPSSRLHEALPDAAVVFLALALTPETTGIIGPEELALMADGAWLVNVARGAHVVTDALVDALRQGRIGGAALDVTDPEPLPDGHPLWDLPNCIITPHTANTLEMARPAVAARVEENVRRFAAGDPLVGTVDLAAGY
jgi:phosphoglycerate dehydrogenase-like enzyme